MQAITRSPSDGLGAPIILIIAGVLQGIVTRLLHSMGFEGWRAGASSSSWRGPGPGRRRITNAKGYLRNTRWFSRHRARHNAMQIGPFTAQRMLTVAVDRVLPRLLAPWLVANATVPEGAR